ncbi:non-ribosomal peptide synthetase [Leucobacter chromiireducens]|uniref:Non-ribosomal peptide synthetase n=1 Tax=Leucobacter chromiireducens subsp. chromiireducens TaxID=660067 RepID=A0ABS1SMY7_9MICO|nr:non-ribosomal peptide synthetase [Leucobacter chromiireducens]MBL3689536.1 non-ribosomal peptide synthetase [Leucobacter chromiireducens subsp. chromiireducens]
MMTNTFGPYPATSAQRSMFLHSAAHPSDTAFDLGFVFRVEGDVDRARLIDATRAVFSATTAFSTTFRHSDDGLIAAPGTGVARVLEFDRTQTPTELLEAMVLEETEQMLASVPIAPHDPHQVTARFYYGRNTLLLSFVASHLVSDAYSFYRVVGMISTLYASIEAAWPDLVSGLGEHPGTVAPPPISPRSIDRYRALVETVPEPASLPLAVRDRGRIRGTRLRLRLDGPEVRALRESEMVGEYGLVAVLFAAHAHVLSRLAGSGAITVGVPVAGRAGHRAKNAVGFFVNTLPLPVLIDGSTTWRSLCGQISSGIRTLQGAQGLNIHGETGSVLFPGSRATIDNAVTFYAQDLALELEGASVVSLPINRTDLPYPLTITFADEQDAIRIEVGVSDAFHQPTAAAQVMQALALATAQPDALVVDDAVFDDASTSSSPVEVAKPELTVIDLIRSIAVTQPHSIALSADEEISYAELADRMLSGAGELDAHEASRLVVVRMRKSIDAVIAILSVLASGRAYVPIDPAAPPHRAQLILSKIAKELDASPTILVDEGATGPGEMCAAVITRTSRRTRPMRPPTVADRAYVIFTSGSTGEPKGVVVSHSALSALLRSARSVISSSARDRWCLFHSLAFDFSVWELFGAITTGGTLIVPRPEEVSHPDAFADLVEHASITVLNQTPSAFRRLADAMRRSTRTFPDVRVVVFGGEALHPADLRSWRGEANAQTRFINMYGITETTVHVTAKEITEPEIDFESRSMIGEPLAHLGIIILDELGRPAAVGVAGELLVFGAGLADEYLGQEELTAARFRTIEVQGRKLRAYCTGDRVRRDIDGELVYLGRIDQQVQLRGYRIELGEIEAAIAATGRTSAAVAALVSPEGREPFLCAWVVTTSEGDADAIRAELGDHIPWYMVPAAVVPLETIPMTRNGKPDVVALPLPAHETDEEVDDSLAGRIARVWEEAIGAGRVRAQDRFLEVGGTSMHVMEVHERLRTDLGLHDLTLVDLFEYSTPAALADYVLSTRA